MTIRIGPPVIETNSEGVRRITRDVDGVPIWFESTIELVPSAEAIVGAMLYGALQTRRTIVIDEPLDEVWLENHQRLIPHVCEWWGYDPKRSYVKCGGVRTATEPRPGIGLCFSGGVDSFYSLLHESSDATHLIFAHGFDIALDDDVRHAQAVSGFEAVAMGIGKTPAHIRTNLRDHPVFAKVLWARLHGAALTSLGHMLSGEIGEQRIASTLQHNELRVVPWGSNPITDPLWSSSAMQVVHGDMAPTRMEKVLSIADDPLVQQHLRVCWENRSDRANCSRCEKCLRTLITLHVTGRLERFPVFEHDLDLPALFDRVSRSPRGYVRDYLECAKLTDDERLSRALRALVWRSDRTMGGKFKRLLHRIGRRVRVG